MTTKSSSRSVAPTRAAGRLEPRLAALTPRASAHALAGFQTTLPAMTFGQLRTLARANSPLSATIRQVEDGYVVELDVGPRRWILISTHRKTPRLFQHLDGAANTVRRLGASPVQLQLAGDEGLPPSLTTTNRS